MQEETISGSGLGSGTGTGTEPGKGTSPISGSLNYKLTGVIIHKGSSDSGHYYSLIKDRELEDPEQEQWYEFNDKIVSFFNPAHIPGEAFG